MVYYRRRLLQKSVLSGVFLTTFFLLTYLAVIGYFSEDFIACYRIKAEALPDITLFDVPKVRSIFFHETSCKSFLEGKIVINARQACAVESAARLNPTFNVYLLYTSPGVFKFNGTASDNMLESLLSYSNIKILHIDYEKYLKDTPLERLYTDRIVESSRYAQSHASDVLRYLTLWKYGGIYVDLDVVVTKSFEDLPLNFAGSESDDFVAAGILGFAPTGDGHSFATRCILDLQDNFSTTIWGYNGPGVITRLLQSLCDSQTAKEMLNKDCHGMTVYPPKIFYPVPWWNWTIYFNPIYNEQIFDITKDSYFVHVWNMFSVHRNISETLEVPYTLFAKKFCPKVFAARGQYF